MGPCALRLYGSLTGAVALAMAWTAPALAHHSFAMFDGDNPIELVGTVKEFRYTNPHTFILLVVEDDKGQQTTWSLEGGAPTALVRAGWTSRTIKPGDELKIVIKPLRGGAPGGAWEIPTVFTKDGGAWPVKH